MQEGRQDPNLHEKFIILTRIQSSLLKKL